MLRADDYLVGVYLYAGDDYYVVEEPLRFRVSPAQGESDDGIRPAVRPQLSWSVAGVEALRREWPPAHHPVLQEEAEVKCP